MAHRTPSLSPSRSPTAPYVAARYNMYLGCPTEISKRSIFRCLIFLVRACQIFRIVLTRHDLRLRRAARQQGVRLRIELSKSRRSSNGGPEQRVRRAPDAASPGAAVRRSVEAFVAAENAFRSKRRLRSTGE